MVERFHKGHLHTGSTRLQAEIFNRATQESVAGAGDAYISAFTLQAISLAAVFVLALVLTPSQYGVFFLVSAVAGILTYFSDIGLGTALIQKKEDLTNSDVRTAFTIQFIITAIFAGILVFGALLFSNFQALGREELYLLWAFAVSMFISSFKTIPNVLLTRRFESRKLSAIEIVEVLTFNVLAVYFAVSGAGITSFTIAILAQSIISTVLAYVLEPWVPMFYFSKSAAKEFFSVGIPYQVNTFLSVLRGDGLTAVLGLFLGTTGIGYLGWAQKFTIAPLRFFMDHTVKGFIPTFSRFAGSKKELGDAVSNAVFSTASLVFPTLIGLALLIPILVQVVPGYRQWQPAVWVVIFYSIASFWFVLERPLVSLLAVAEKLQKTTWLFVVWTALAWGLSIFLAQEYGAAGAAAGIGAAGVVSLGLLLYVRGLVDYSFLGGLIKPLVASLVMGAILYFTKTMFDVSLFPLLGMIFIGVFSYFIFLIILQ